MFPAIRFIYLPYFVEFDIIAYGNRIKERYGNDRIFFKVSEIHFCTDIPKTGSLMEVN